MKKIFLAGYPDTTHNYKNAFAALGVPADALPLQEKEPVFESRLSALSDLSGYDGLVPLFLVQKIKVPGIWMNP